MPATPTGRTKRTAAPAVRRNQLLDAAARVLVSKGLSAMTVSEVAEVAGLGKGTVYLYFDTKEALLAGLQARYLDTLMASAGTLLSGDGGHVERLDAFLASTVEFHVANRQLHQVLFHESGMRDDEALQRLADTLTSFINDGAAAGVFDVSAPAFAAQFLLHGLHGVLVSFLHQPKPSPAPFIDACQSIARQLLSVRTRAPKADGQPSTARRTRRTAPKSIAAR